MPRRSLLSVLLVALLPFGVEAVSVSLGGSHSCALLDDGKVMCWGKNKYGQLGDGSATDRSSPVEVSGLTNAQSIALGGGHSCALLTDGKVMCWGFNNHGQLGDGTTSARIFPVEVSGITAATRASLLAPNTRVPCSPTARCCVGVQTAKTRSGFARVKIW